MEGRAEVARRPRGHGSGERDRAEARRSARANNGLSGGHRRTRADRFRIPQGSSVYTTWRPMHLSVYRRRNSDRLRFRLDGELPAFITTVVEARAFLWRRLLSKIGAAL